jgi:hypothetical protein
MIEIASAARGRGRPTRVSARHLLVLLLVGLRLLIGPPTAHAGEWTQVTCTQPNGQPAPTEGWTGTSVGGLSPYSSANDNCGQQGGYLIAANSSRVTVGRSTGPMWEYAVPSGSTIAGGSITVSLTAPQGQAYLATPNNVTDGADILANCQFNLPCGSSGSYSAIVPIEHLGGTKLYAAAMCVGPGQPGSSEADCAAGDGANGLNAQTVVYAADTELASNSTPTATDFAGSLLASAASGTADLTFSAQDPEGPGVYRVIVDVDGNAVYQGTPEANGGRCASIGVDSSGVAEFLYAQPCKRDVAIDVPVVTTRFPNGQHELKVIVQDAAGNTSVVYDGTISISNADASASSGPITGSGGLSSQPFSRGPANGTNASEQATLTAHWKSTAKADLTSGYNQPHVIAGRLTGPGATPIAGALIDLTATPAYAGAKPITMTNPRTARDGSFSVKLAGGLSSRRILLAYRSHLNDTLPVATHTLMLSVRAAITLRISPQIASVDRRIYFKGMLRGDPIPPGGKQLVLEARSAGTPWLEFNVIRTDSRGRFNASYRFRLAGHHRYRFRVISKYEADFPFAAGASNAVLVEEQ